MQSPYEPDRDVTVHDLTAVVEALAQELRLADWRLVSASPPGFHPVRAASIVVDGAVVGSVGEIDAEVVDALALPARWSRARSTSTRCSRPRECRARRVRCRAIRRRRSTSRSSFPTTFPPAQQRTLRGPVASSSSRCASSTCSAPTRSAPGKVSLAFALKFRAPDRTLTDAEVGELRQQCIDAVVSAFGAELRG